MSASSSLLSLTDQAIALVERARDPIEAVKLGSQLGRILHQIRARTELAAASAASRANSPPTHAAGQEGGDWPLAALGCSHIIRVPNVPALAPPPAGATSITSALRVEWPGGEGKVRSLFAGTLDGDPASLSRVSVRIAINGADELFTDGEEEAYVPLLSFQAANHNWFRLKDYRVDSSQKWQVYFQNEGPPGSPPVTPFLLFGYARTAEAAR
jgi:hypothetical protein